MRRSSVTGIGDRPAMAFSARSSPPEDRILGWMPRAGSRISCIPSRAFSRASVTSWRVPLGQLEPDDRVVESLLCPIVQVALDAPARLVGGRHDSPALTR